MEFSWNTDYIVDYFHFGKVKGSSKNYQGVSQKLFGKYVIIKTNLPWIITGSFFVITLFIRFVFDVIIPVWIAVFFVIVLAISVFYSIGIERKIAEYIDKESNSTNQTKI